MPEQWAQSSARKVFPAWLNRGGQPANSVLLWERGSAVWPATSLRHPEIPMWAQRRERAESTFLNCSEAALTMDTELGAQTSTHVVALSPPQMPLTCKPCKSYLQNPLRRLFMPVEIPPGFWFSLILNRSLSTCNITESFPHNQQ